METGIIEQLQHEFSTPLTNPILGFSLILFIILIVPNLLKFIKVPGIIGLILSGVLIGPYSLNILEKNSAIDLFATIGVLYIMFIAGLELDIDEFKKYKYKSLIFGFFTFIIPLSLGYPICHYFLGYGEHASFLTASMFATHTMVAYPIVSKFGLSKLEAVGITTGGTIITDTAVLIILAVVMGSVKGSLDHFFWIRLIISLLVFMAIMFLVVPRIASWFFRKLESEKNSHYIFVLAVVFFAAFLADIAGLEPIIGAFAAGLALNRLIPHSSALMNRIEFIGNSLFIPFFLISVGMLVDIRVLLSGPQALIVAAVLSIVALAGKWVAAFITQLFAKYTISQRQLIFGLSSAHAAATLAVILVGYEAGVLDKNILNGTILLILVTCLVSSFVTENAARRIVVNAGKKTLPESAKISDPNKEHILLPIADISKMESLLNFAILIKNKRSPNPITVLSVVPNDREAEENLQQARKNLESSVKLAAATETKVNVIATIDHHIASGIARASKEIMADSIIMGWPRKPGILDRYIGGKTENILNNTDKNIYICLFERAIVTHQRILLVCLPQAELEKGFATWVTHTFKLANELTLPIVLYCSQQTAEAINQFAKQNNWNTPIIFKTIENWEDLLVLLWDVSKEDIFILVSARRGAISHNGNLDRMPAKIEKHMRDISRIIIYPETHFTNSFYDEF
jgi:Kef-type K+ transport system membrane component KefB